MNHPTKQLIKAVNSYLDGDPADALVALYYISVDWHGGMGDPLYAVAHQSGFKPGMFSTFDGEPETVKMVYEEIEAHISEGKTSYHYDWDFIVRYYSRIFSRRAY